MPLSPDRYTTPQKKYRYITTLNSFHGRTFAAVTATAQSKYHQGFSPLVPGFTYIPFNDPAALEEAFDDEVAAVLVDEDGQLETFLERTSILGEKLGCIVFQFPYFRVKEFSLKEFLPRLEATLEKVPEDTRVAVEVRNKTWLKPDYLALLEGHGAAAVLIDHPYMPCPEDQLEAGMVTTDFSYVRLLGDRYGIEKKTKTWEKIVEDKSERLGRWSRVISEIASRPAVRSVMAFSNNHYAGHAPATSRELASLLGAPLLLDHQEDP